MSLAFLVLAHKNPRQLARLATALEGPGRSIFMHIDARQMGVQAVTRQVLGASSPVRFVEPAVACRWGSYSVVQATLNGLRAMHAARVRADHVVLISGQDYPLVSNRAMDGFFAQHRGRQFMECFALDEPNRWSEHSGRYQARARLEAFNFALRSRWFSLPMSRRLPEGFRGYGGAQWWALSGDCVEGLLDQLQRHPAIERYFRHSFIPDELFFQTLVMNSRWRDSVDNRHLRYVDFTRANPTPPAVLMAADLEAIYREPEALIARKFDIERDEGVLDLIDARRAAAPIETAP